MPEGFDMTPYIKPIAAAVALAASFAAGWSWNGSRHDAEIAEMRAENARRNADAQAQARTKEQALTKQLNEARNEATKRETILRADADRAHKSAGGLRDELAELRSRLPELSADACRERADTIAELFGQCSEHYRSLAEAADRIESERQELIDAWPK